MRVAALPLFLFCAAVWAQPAPPAPTFLSDSELRRAIETAPEEVAGQPGLYSLRLSPPSEAPVIGIRRTTSGRSEMHADFTDVWYVIDGAGVLVTGGTIVGGIETVPGEVRGEGIRDGNARPVRKGEFAVIPAGTPHWLSAVEGKEILYIVVKVPIRNDDAYQ